MLNNLGQNNSLINEFIAEIRDKEIQKDSLRFRKNLERIGEIFAYEISKKLDYIEKKVTTPLGVSKVKMLKDEPVLATILRAGIPFHQGFLNYFDKSKNAFITAYRKHDKNNKEIAIQIDYISSPILKNKILIICDPMLATAYSMVDVYKKLLENGKPQHTHIAVIIASIQGLRYLEKFLPSNEVTIWTGAIDKHLNNKFYIVPGLGDAGDLSYGCKN